MKIAIFITVLLFTLALPGCSTNAEDGESASVPDAPPVEVTAAQMLTQYNVNEVAADQKYKGKRLSVTGYVHDIGTGVLGSPYITLGRPPYHQTVYCLFGKERSGDVARLTKGSWTMVEGVGVGVSLAAPSMKECSVVSTERLE